MGCPFSTGVCGSPRYKTHCMVFFESKVSDRIDSPLRLQRKSTGTEESNHVNHSPLFPLGLSKTHWKGVVQVLKVPHFSHTKKLDLIHETRIPVIYGDYLLPVVPWIDTLFTYGMPTEPAVRIATHVCPQCFEEDMRIDSKMDVKVCAICGCHEIYDEPFSYKRKSRQLTTARKLSTDFYKRLVHFKFWIKRIQGKERHQVTGEDIEQVRQLLVKDNMNGIHYWNVRNCLQRLKMQRHYNHCVYIMSKIRGKPLVMMTKNQEQILIEMFMTLQHSFSLLSSSRVNMLSYPYVIKKLCELKGWFNMARIIPTLKSNVRIMMQDDLWRKICEDKKWRFIPTQQWSSLETRSLMGRPH